MRSGTSRSLAAVATLACIALAGCGGDGDDATDTQADEPAEFAIYDWEPNLVSQSGYPTESAAREASAARDGEGAVVVLRDESGEEPGRYFAVRDRPTLTSDDLTVVSVSEVPGPPSLNLGLDADGQRRFEALAATVSKRGGHFAIVIDDEVVSLPVIDPATDPSAFDPSAGVQITGLPDQELQDLADRVAEGAGIEPPGESL